MAKLRASVVAFAEASVEVKEQYIDDADLDVVKELVEAEEKKKTARSNAKRRNVMVPNGQRQLIDPQGDKENDFDCESGVEDSDDETYDGEDISSMVRKVFNSRICHGGRCKCG